MRIANSLAPYAFTAATLILGLEPQSAFAQYSQTNVVSDVPNQANFTDTNLVNPWGMSSSPTSPVWVANEGSGVATLYRSSGPLALVVTVPPPPGSPVGTLGTPTGTVFNPNFNNGNPAPFLGDIFLFSTLSGQITGWQGGTSAAIRVDNSVSGAMYTGLAINTTSSTLYAANFNSAGINVFDSAFVQISLAGNFADPNLPAGFAPFNIQNLNGQLYVTYAQSDSTTHVPVPGVGAGFIDVFNLDGSFVKRLASNGSLNEPWGLALAPPNFGPFSGDLLVGNHGDGMINAFDPITGLFLGTLKDAQGNPIINPGLWALAFGNGASFDSNALLFTAGTNGGGYGLFGEILPTPLPGALPLFATGLGALGLLGWRRKRKNSAAA